MPAAPYPQTIPQAFAMNASGGDRNTIPDAPVTTQRASWSLGFPPLVMTPRGAGGKPMLGPDMNGALYAISTHIYYQQSGKLYLFNADVMVLLGGYAIGTLLGSIDGSTVWFNTTASNMNDPDAATSTPNGWVALFSYGTSSIGGLNGGIRTLTMAEASKGVIVLSGTLVANQAIVVPPQLRRWLIVNATSGAFSTTVRTAAGTGVAVPQGGFAAPVEVYTAEVSAVVNVYNVVAPVSLPIDQAATPSTIVQRTNVADVFARYYNSNGGVDNNAIVNLFYDAGDGYLRKMTQANFRVQLFDAAALTGASTAPTQAAGTNDTRIATTAFVQAAGVGTTGQSWSQPLRAFSTFYTNTTGRPIQVSVAISYLPGSRSATLVVDGVTVAQGASGGSAASTSTLSAIVPHGSTYIVVPSGGPTLNSWAELR